MEYIAIEVPELDEISKAMTWYTCTDLDVHVNILLNFIQQCYTYLDVTNFINVSNI